MRLQMERKSACQAMKIENKKFDIEKARIKDDNQRMIAKTEEGKGDIPLLSALTKKLSRVMGFGC